VFQFLTPHSFAVRYEILTVLISNSDKFLLDLVHFFHLYSYVHLGDYIEVTLRIIFLRYNAISRFSITFQFFSLAKKFFFFK